jgi:multidrug efflux pump subunit AcrA (membrane-fusion protein)
MLDLYLGLHTKRLRVGQLGNVLPSQHPIRVAEDVAMLEAPATVLATPESNAGVSPPFRARIVRVRVKPGEKVKRGDVVADVVMPDVVQAAGTYASAATRVGAYERRAAQLEALKKEGMVRLSELLDVQTKLAEARADQQSALAMLRVAGLAAEDAQRLLASRGGEVSLRSPIDGVVTQVKAAIGENREAAGEPLVRLAGESEPRVEARCARVMPKRAEYELWLASGERHPLLEVGRAPQVDPRDGTMLVWFAPEAGTRLVQGQTGKVKIRLEEEEGAVAVPARAVGLGPKGPFVVANRGGKAQRLEVEVLAASGAEALVRAASLKIGDEVAADAAQTDEGAAAEAARPLPPDQDARREGGGT